MQSPNQENMSKISREVVQYSFSFKQQIVQEIETGKSSISELRRRYGIGGAATIPNWIRKFGRNHLLNKVVRIETMEEKDRLKQLEEENKRLKIALADACLAKDCLSTLVDLAKERYNMDLKKTFGTPAPKDSGKDTK